MDAEKKLQTIIQEANQHIVLQSQEKEAIRSNILKFMKANPPSALPTQPVPAVFLAWTSMFKIPVARYATLAALCLVVLGGGVVSVAAQYALPGEALYPVKVGVNEKVLSFIAFSDEQRAEYDIKLAQTRLEEMEKVVAMDGENDTKNAQVKKLLDQHIASATARTKRIADKRRTEFSARINSELEASLQAHEKVLDALSLVPGKQPNRKQAARNFVSGVKANTKKAVQARQEDERELSGKTSAADNALNVASKIRMEAAKRAVADFNTLINDGQFSLTVKVKAQAELAINQANALIIHGEGRMNSEEFASAFADFQQAIRVVQEAKIQTKASAQFKISVPALNQGDDGDDNQGEQKSPIKDIINNTIN